MLENTHIHLSRRCGICGRLFVFLDRCAALVGNPDATAYRLTTKPFCYPVAPGGRGIVDGVPFCRSSTCYMAKVGSPESATLHHDCFEVLKSACTRGDVLDRLWSLAVWRTPWRDAARIFLPQEPVISSQGVAAVARGFGVAGFVGRLPAEIEWMIYGYSESAAFWRLAAALDLAAEFNETKSTGKVISHPLGRVASWERGGGPVLSPEKDHLPVIRLTIDSFGIRSIERLPDEEAPYSNARFNNLAFVFVHKADLLPGPVTVTVKNGHARLKLPKEHEGLQIWDTPNLPSLPRPPVPWNRRRTVWSESESMRGPGPSDWMVYGDGPESGTRFRTIDLSSITGLTFCYDDTSHTLRGIHVHTPTAPLSALAPESDASMYRQVWIYVPISATDRITGIAINKKGETRRVGGLLIRTRLGGVRPVGPVGPLDFMFGGDEINILGNPPKTLIHDTHEQNGVSLIGAYPRPQPKESDAAILEYPVSQSPPVDLTDGHALMEQSIHYSSAPLAGVISADVFRRGREASCRGMLLTYENGWQMALGDCRLGVDGSRRYERPRLLCMANKREPGPAPLQCEYWSARAQFETGGTHGHDEDGWECFDMEGTLEFWFTHQRQYLKVIPA